MEYQIKNVLANGIACGKVFFLKNNIKAIQAEGVLVERKRLDMAFKSAFNELDNLLECNPNQKDYIAVQKLMLNDSYLYNGIVDKIESGLSAYKATEEVISDYIKDLSSSVSEYLNERVNDFNDIKNRLVTNLSNNEKIKLNEKYVVICEEIYPFFLINNQNNILGIISKKGGFTSHCAIMCRSLEIPYVICDNDILVKENEQILIDTQKKIIKNELTNSELSHIKENIELVKNENNEATKHDGYLFLANISSNEEIDKVIKNKFDGVGLYRTEMIFMMSNRPYTKEEQKKIYLEAINKLKDKYIVFRTFDIGDDKKLSYLKSFKKGIDNYKNNPLIFENQIRALLEANIYGNMRIMFPMIFSNEEFNYLRDWVLKINKEINGNHVMIGMMLETKHAIESITEFKNVDFISVGTNDLTTELYNINRLDGLDKVNSYIDDLLAKLKKVVEFTNENNICFSICGELAGNIETALRFYKIGVKNLSVNPGAMKMLNLVYSKYNSIK